MSVNIRYPNIVGTSDREQLTQIKSYLHQLVDQLNYALPSLGTGDDSAQAPSSFEVQGGEISYYELRSLIIQEMQEVERLFEQLSKKMQAEYVSNNELHQAVDDAIEDAIESGEFVGPPGPKGENGDLSTEEKDLILSLFENASYEQDMTESLDRLKLLWSVWTVDASVQSGTCVDSYGNDVSANTLNVNYGDRLVLYINPDEYYSISNVTVTMGGENITESVYADGVITIPSVTANVEVSAECSREVRIVNVDLVNCGGSSQYTILNGDSFGLLISPDDGYELRNLTVTMGGEDITEAVYSNGIIKIPSVTANVSISGYAELYE